ncbi:YCII-related protein [Beutenbergia cavernae DSM 12333]|uniref:YCII-related protein n=1 Tax=Beutenbergia cavernae (strain ATCC BAA-8 / DSM 12333 / CCUG 43141 / JCM 11478 / NBRC 16432 / NCIMB 13614 / HKI 0122) TaxID=471853 RepID=C5BV45_BEUC1|nr:YciI family protein [Beutenbergia cavernae]ACQ80432.1 YCII-related protein [Beutenbergia cavernae DSM 12333]
MPVYAVEYTYAHTPDAVAVRDEVRPAHRDFLRGLERDGRLLASGPFTGSPGALLLVRGDDADEALRALDADPFAAAGIIADREARAWEPVIGPWASAL